MKEIWKPIKGYENNYEISNMGNVRNKKTKQLLSGDINNAGYRRVILYVPNKKRFFIHRLVAYHFCEGFNDNLIVNHKNGNKTDNRAENLEWITRSENDLHAYQHDLRHAHVPFHKGDVYYKILEYSTGLLIKEYPNREAVLKDYPMTASTFQVSINRGWFFKDWHNKKLGKYKIIRYFK